MGPHRLKINAAGISGQPPLNVFVQDFIGRADEADIIRLVIPDFDMRMAKSQPVKVSAVIKNRPIAEQNSLAAKIVPQMLDCNGFRPTPMMTADQVQEAEKYHEIGVHSFEHATMGLETDEYLVEDAQRCRAYMKKTLGIDFDIYAFPNGSYRISQIALLSEAGYERILLVGDAFSQKYNNVHPRFGFRAAGIFEARFRAVGGIAPVQHWDNQ